MGKPLFTVQTFVWWHDMRGKILYMKMIYKYLVDITMECMVLHVTDKYTEL